MKKFIIIIVVVLAVLFMLPVAIFFTVQHPKVQQRLVGEVTRTLSEKLHTTVSVEGVSFRLFNRLVLEGVYVQDLKGDTLLYVGEAAVSLTRFGFSEKYIGVGKLALDNVRFALVSDSVGTNLSFIVDGLKSPQRDTAPKPKTGDAYSIRVNRVVAQGVHFTFEDKYLPDTVHEGSICYKNLDVSNLSLDVRELNLDGDTMSCRLESLSFHERSGFNLRRLGGFVSMAPTFIEIKDLQVLDDYSDIQAHFYRMDFADYSALSDYVEKVRMSADFISAKVDIRTIGFFAHPLSTVHLPVSLTGYAEGTVSNLKGRDMELKYGAKTAVKVNFSMVGLPDAHNTFFTFDVKNLQSNGNDIMLADSMLLNGGNARHAPLLRQLGALKGRARFTGFLSNFVADGVLVTDKGTLITDLSFVPAADSAVAISGTLGTDNFDLGSIINDSIIGRLSIHGKADGTIKSLKEMALHLDVDIPLVEVKGYAYRASKMKGLLTEKSFNGTLSCDDKNLDFDFRGNVDFEKQKPIFDFDLQMHHADLVQLHLNTRDSVSRVNFAARAAVEGSSVDDIVGQIAVSNAKYISPIGEFATASVLVNVRNQGDVKNIQLKSDLLDATLQAKGGMSGLLATLNQTMGYYIPAFAHLLNEDKLNQTLTGGSSTKKKPQSKDKAKPHTAAPKAKETEYNFVISIKNAKNAFRIIAPNFVLADSSQIGGRISSDVQRTRINARTSLARFGKLEITNFTLRSIARDSSLLLAAKADRVMNGDLSVHDLNLNTTLKQGRAAFTSDYKTSIASGNLRAEAQIFRDAHGDLGVDVALSPSKVVLGDTLWNLSQSGLRFEKNKYSIKHFKLENAHQSMYVNGVISKSLSDTLSCELRNLSIAPLLNIFGMGHSVAGVLSGKASINGVLAPAPLFFANMRAANVSVATKEVGNITLQTFIEQGEKDITLQLRVERGGEEVLGVGGVVKTAGEVLAVAKLNGVELDYLNPLLSGVLSDVDGTVSGTVKVAGPLKHLRLNGKLQVDSAALRVDLLNALFKTSGLVDVENSDLHMRNWTAIDDKGGTAKVNFTLANVTQPAKIRYSLKVEPQNLHVLNSNELQNANFYGQGYATGAVQINGQPGDVSINVAVATDRNTQVSIPLGGAASTQQSNFIDFVTPAAKSSKKEEEKQVQTASNLKADLDFRITPDAEMQLVLNQNTGDVIKASGSGNIKLEVQPTNNIFRIFGNYTLLRGEYSVSIQNLFSLKFKIDNGSVINFNGDINAATADIQASYKQLRVPLAELFGDTTSNSRYSRPVPIDCKVRMTGRLTAPDLKFSIDAPTVDAETRDRMRAQLNTEDNVVTQFMSLILIGQFVPAQGSPSAGGSIVGGLESLSLGSFLTSQVAGLLSQFVEGVDVNVKVPVGQDANQDWGVTLSTNIGSRISVSGSVESQQKRKQYNPNSSQYIGDLDVEYMVDKQGKLRLKAFSHANDQYTEMTQTGNRFGVGVVYQEDFDNFADLWQTIFRRKKTQDSIARENEKREVK